MWRQFIEFCKSKITLLRKVAQLKDWAYNMKKRNGEDYSYINLEFNCEDDSRKIFQ